MKSRLLFVSTLCISIIIFSQFGCSKSGSNAVVAPPVNSCNGINPSFATQVLPLIQTKCATNSGCHASGSTNSGGPLTTFAQINNRSSNIKSQVNSGAMPQNSSLTATEKSTIVCWVSNGATNN